MTDQEINIAIAPLCGWVRVKTSAGAYIVWSDGGFASWADAKDDWYHSVPNYCSDLNAMHEAVATLSEEEYGDDDGFTVMLAIVTQGAVQPPNAWKFRPMQEATARQRAEAFLKAKGLWKW